MQYDTDEELSPSSKVIRVVADARGYEPTALDALRLFHGLIRGGSRADGSAAGPSNSDQEPSIGCPHHVISAVPSNPSRMSDQRKSDTLVLVVDDEKELAELYSTWLSDDYATKTAYSGSEALEIIDPTVDIVLLDRQLPDLDGEEILARIRKQRFDCSVAMVTAVEPDFDIIQTELDEYLTKPVSEDELKDVVSSLLARKQYDEKVNELFSLVTKRAVLMEEKSSTDLKRSDEYRELVRRIQTVNTELDDIYGLSARDTEALFAQLDSPPYGDADD